MKNCVKLLSNVVVALLATVMFFTACEPEVPVDEGNEGDGGEQVEQPEEPDQTELNDSLAFAFQRQLRAMSKLMTEESLLLAYCNAAEQEGLFEMSFEGDVSFAVFPGKDDVYKIMSYVEEDGVKSWACVDKEGNVAALKNAADSKISCDVCPDVVVTSEGYALKHNESSIKLEYAREDAVQAFDCSVLKDADGVVYAVDFVFGEGKSRTVYVSTYTGSKFYFLEDESKTLVTELCVDWGTTATLGVYVPEGVEYKFVSVEGWNISMDEQTANVTVAAPEMSENANSQGIIKVVSKDDLFTFAQLHVTTDPFRTLLTSATKAVVVPSMGIDKFAYGISVKSDFDADATLAAANKWIAGEETPVSGGVSETTVSKIFAEILGAELDDESEYVLWAVANNHLKSFEFTDVNIDIQTVKTYLLDADIKVAVKGASAVFGGVVEKSEETMSEIMYQLENSILDSIPVTSRYFNYEGLLSDYPAVDNVKKEISQATTYVVWAAYAVDGEYEYTQDDIFYAEVSTNSIVAGGDKIVTFGTPETTVSTVNVSVSSVDATMIYYAVLTNSEGKRYSTDATSNEQKYENMMKYSPVAVTGNSAIAGKVKLEPSSTYWIYAVAVDKEGKYGPVSCVSAKTKTLQYDETIKLTVDTDGITSDKVVVKVTSAGGDLSDYIYWVGRKTETFWRTYCADSKFTAEKYMALNPEDENIVKAMNRYGKISADGTLIIDGLLMETEYVFVILEKSEVGYSRIGYVGVKTLAADLGTIVREGSDEWNAAKNAVKFEWHKNEFDAPMGLMASYGFKFSCQDNLTAYVMVASDEYFADSGITKMEHIMIAIENEAGSIATKDGTPIGADGELMSEPDYYKNGSLVRASLMNVYEYHAHGNPRAGRVTYFAKGSHGKDECYGWENGHCAQYDECMAKIQRFLTLTPWENRAASFGLEGQEKAAWAQALLDAYSVYYKDAKPHIYENDGKGIDMYQPYGSGPDDNGVVTDRVFVMFKDLQGNYYEPMSFEVPNYFE